MTYEALKAEWDAVWASWSDEASAAWQSVVETTSSYAESLSPSMLEAQVSGFIELLDQLGSLLDRWKELIASLPAAERGAQEQALAEYQAAFDYFSAGFWPFTQEASTVQGARVGVAPLVVGALAVSAVAAAWAVGKASELGETVSEVYLRVTELNERVAASKEGRVLQESTVPQLNADKPEEGGYGLVLGGLALAAAAGLGAWAWSRS